jgi:hypothetical protein
VTQSGFPRRIVELFEWSPEEIRGRADEVRERLEEHPEHRDAVEAYLEATVGREALQRIRGKRRSGGWSGSSGGGPRTGARFLAALVIIAAAIALGLLLRRLFTP